MQIDGLTITYNETAGNVTESVSHGTEPGSTDSTLQRKEFDLNRTTLSLFSFYDAN
jgi:hypothetical protein